MLARPEASEAFKREMVSHLPAVRNFLLKLIKNPVLVEDMTQETMLVALEHHHQYRPGNMAAWLVTIARYEWYSRWRRDRGRWLELDPEYDKPAPACQDDAVELADVLRLMGRLSGQKRAVLAAIAVGYEYHEAADLLGMPIGTVKSACYRARESLAGMMRVP